jgi:large subunit ribosomal protein L2
MGIEVRKQKPTSPGRRGYVKVVNTDLHKGKPEKSLLVAKKRSGGRNNNGRITTFHRGGGHKQHYRLIDWTRIKDGVPGKVERLEYDPNRTADIALILYADGERRYIIAPKGLAAGDKILSGADASVGFAVGNCLPMSEIPLGTLIHCIEMKPGKGAQMVRSAGCSARLMAKEGKYVNLKLRSGESRQILAACRAVIGEVGRTEHHLAKEGKAGRQRWRGVRPTVRGVAMNPVDHPLGGGEGKSSGGRPPCSPWGKPEGKKTRNKKSPSSKFIILRRKNKSEKK